MFTTKQIAALKYLIFIAKNGTDLSKRVLALLIDSSKNLTKEVCVSLVADREGYDMKKIEAAGYDAAGMKSSNGTTHLDQILHAMGSDLRFSFHYGDFDPTRSNDPFNIDGMFAGVDRSQVASDELVYEGQPIRYTFWLAKELYSRHAVLIVTTREQLDQINLKKPGLYPSLEPT